MSEQQTVYDELVEKLGPGDPLGCEVGENHWRFERQEPSFIRSLEVYYKADPDGFRHLHVTKRVSWPARGEFPYTSTTRSLQLYGVEWDLREGMGEALAFANLSYFLPLPEGQEEGECKCGCNTHEAEEEL